MTAIREGIHKATGATNELLEQIELLKERTGLSDADLAGVERAVEGMLVALDELDAVSH